MSAFVGLVEVDDVESAGWLQGWVNSCVLLEIFLSLFSGSSPDSSVPEDDIFAGSSPANILRMRFFGHNFQLSETSLF